MPQRNQSADRLFGPLLYLALAEPIGLLLDSGGDTERALARLYTARRNLADPALRELQFRRAGVTMEGDVVIVNRKLSRGKRSLLDQEEAGDVQES